MQHFSRNTNNTTQHIIKERALFYFQEVPSKALKQTKALMRLNLSGKCLSAALWLYSIYYTLSTLETLLINVTFILKNIFFKMILNLGILRFFLLNMKVLLMPAVIP